MTLGAVNAAAEEWMWRGVPLRALLTRSPAGVAIAVQSASFGLAHLNGIPGGASGVVLACLFGVATGWLALRTGALRWPILAHLVPRRLDAHPLMVIAEQSRRVVVVGAPATVRGDRSVERTAPTGAALLPGRPLAGWTSARSGRQPTRGEHRQLLAHLAAW